MSCCITHIHRMILKKHIDRILALHLNYLFPIAVGCSVLLFLLIGEPHARGFFCYDESLMHPYHKSTVKHWMLFVFGIILPIVIVSKILLFFFLVVKEWTIFIIFKKILKLFLIIFFCLNFHCNKFWNIIFFIAKTVSLLNHYYLFQTIIMSQNIIFCGVLSASEVNSSLAF